MLRTHQNPIPMRRQFDRDVLLSIIHDLKVYWISSHDPSANQSSLNILKTIDHLSDACRELPETFPDVFLSSFPEELYDLLLELTKEREDLLIMSEERSHLLLTHMARICFFKPSIFTNILPTIKSQSIVSVKPILAEEDAVDVIHLLVIESHHLGELVPISPSAVIPGEREGTFKFHDIIALKETKWSSLVKKCSEQWKVAFSEMLLLESRNADHTIDLRNHCEKRLKVLVETYGALPVSFHVSGLSIAEYAINGGQFGDVFQGMLGTRKVCVKALRIFINTYNREVAVKQLAKEAFVWFKLKHPNILPFTGVDLTIRRPAFCLVSPWMENGNIIDFLRSHPGMKRLPLAQDVLEGLRYLHQRDPPIVHGDLRGANILITDECRACLGDFGLATAVEKYTGGTGSTGSCRPGAPRWLPPEVLDPDGKYKRAPTKQDIYAFGCVMLEIYTGDVPFAGLQDVAILTKVVLKKENPPLPQNPSPELELLIPEIKRCWSFNPKDRPDVSKINLKANTGNRRQPPPQRSPTGLSAEHTYFLN